MPTSKSDHGLTNKVKDALSSKFKTTGVSYEGNFTALSTEPLSLSSISAIFGAVGCAHTYVDSTFSVTVVVEEIVAQHKDQKNLDLLNYIVVKLNMFDNNITFKIYRNRYFQLFGIADTEVFSASTMLEWIIRFLISKLNEQSRVVGPPSSPPVLLALSANHRGISENGMRFNLEEVERAFSDIHKGNPHFKITKNARNNSLVVHIGKKAGSQIYHGSGTVQLLGFRSPPETALEALRVMISEWPECVIASQTAVKLRKKKARCQQPHQAWTVSTSTTTTSTAISVSLSHFDEQLCNEFFRVTDHSDASPCIFGLMDVDAVLKMASLFAF